MSQISESANDKATQKFVLFPKIGQVNFFLSVTPLHSPVCIRIYIFSFKNKQTTPPPPPRKDRNKKKLKKKREYMWKV